MNTKKMILGISAIVVLTTAYFAVEAMANRGDGALGVVCVTSQGLYYDTFVSAQSLPPHGPFQLLEEGVTEFGPGDRGYVGGRWQIPNKDPDGNYDGTYTYLLCPLLGPGRLAP